MSFVAATMHLPFSESTKEVFNVQRKWNSVEEIKKYISE